MKKWTDVGGERNDCSKESAGQCIAEELVNYLAVESYYLFIDIMIFVNLNNVDIFDNLSNKIKKTSVSGQNRFQCKYFRKMI